MEVSVVWRYLFQTVVKQLYLCVLIQLETQDVTSCQRHHVRWRHKTRQRLVTCSHCSALSKWILRHVRIRSEMWIKRQCFSENHTEFALVNHWCEQGAKHHWKEMRFGVNEWNAECVKLVWILYNLLFVYLLNRTWYEIKTLQIYNTCVCSWTERELLKRKV